MAKGKLTKLFPGGNTPQGFYSFYDNIIGKDASRFYILKGGPGTGKSTFMRLIGETMLEMGHDVEYHCCSADNDSLDGICIPAIKTAVVDGTAPHMLDPRIPGAVDEIIYLGDFWDKEKLRSAKKHIIDSGDKVKRFYRIAYCQLAEAKTIKDELDGYYEEAACMPLVHQTAWQIIDQVTQPNLIQSQREPENRRMFATAITSAGQRHHYNTILQDVKILYLVAGEASAIASGVIGTVAQIAHARGLNTNTFHCPLEPEAVDLLVLPQLSSAVMKNIPGINFKTKELPFLSGVKVYNLDKHFSQTTLTMYENEIINANKRLFAAIIRTVKYLSKARDEHYRLESLYFPAIDFDRINGKREEVLAEILNQPTL
jgi:hypothetical protein